MDAALLYTLSYTSMKRTVPPRPADSGNPLTHAPAPPPEGLHVRHLRTHEEYVSCVALQEETWGAAFSERVPAAILKVSQRLGGITAGAFDAQDRLLGFVFGLTGVENGRLVHWSDMLAVRPEYRDHGIGRRLKEFQRETLLGMGVERVYWTFDPLVARNAHFNFNRLGVRVAEYVIDMYGRDTDSALHRGLGTDRFIVVWEIASPESPGSRGAPRRPEAQSTARVVNASDGDGVPAMPQLRDGPAAAPLRVEIPLAIDTVQDASLELAGRWRATTRAAFTWALEHGYRVAGFYRDAPAGRGYYVLARQR
jgi:predicted GNAT superfamily acetyltransferase